MFFMLLNSTSMSGFCDFIWPYNCSSSDQRENMCLCPADVTCHSQVAHSLQRPSETLTSRVVNYNVTDQPKHWWLGLANGQKIKRHSNQMYSTWLPTVSLGPTSTNCWHTNHSFFFCHWSRVLWPKPQNVWHQAFQNNDTLQEESKLEHCWHGTHCANIEDSSLRISASALTWSCP